jgi:hypothetical protein
MNNEEQDQRILGCDGIITGCSGAIIGAVIVPFLLLAFLANTKPAGDFGPLAGIIILLFFVCIGALIGGILGSILNRIINRIMKR